MRRGELLLPTRPTNFQADPEDLLRAFKAHTGFFAKRNYPCRNHPADAAVGQFLFTALHEVGHATFEISNISIFGHEEDAADNFATYVMLQFGTGQARRLIGGAAWAWRGDCRRHGRQTVYMNIKRWPKRFITRSVRILIRKWPGGF